MYTPTAEEIKESLDYLNSFEKGQQSMDLSPEINGGKEEKISLLKGQMTEYVKKAKACQMAIDKIEKGEKPDELEEDVKEEAQKEGETVVEEQKEKEVLDNQEKIEKSQPSIDVLELRKSLKTEVLGEVDSLIKAKDQEIIGLRTRLETLENEPIKKSLTGMSAIKDKFEKSQSEGFTPVSRFQKSKISDALLNSFDSEKDEMRKGRIGDEIAMWESASHLTPFAEQILQENKIQVID